MKLSAKQLISWLSAGAAATATARTTEAAAEGVAAFLEKRPPHLAINWHFAGNQSPTPRFPMFLAYFAGRHGCLAKRHDGVRKAEE